MQTLGNIMKKFWMALLDFVKNHPFGLFAFIFAVCAGVVANFVYDGLRHEANDKRQDVPVIIIVVSPSQGGGPDSRGVIAGKVEGIKDPNAYRVVVYALTDHWYVQPTRDDALTLINKDGKWATQTHLGTSYAALLVDKSFVPPPQASAIPRGKSVLAQVTVDAHIGP
jgi:hypothetical protein